MLPEGASVTPPPLTVRVQCEVRILTGPVTRSQLCSFPCFETESYSGMSADCVLSEVTEERLSRTSAMTRGLPRIMIRRPITGTWTISPAVSTAA